MAEGRPSPALTLEREVRAWDLACRGKSQDDIARELGVSQPAVSKILKRVTTRHMKRLDAEVAAWKAVSTARLQNIISEALDAWDASKKPRQKSRSRKTLIPLNLAQLEPGQPIIGDPNLPVREEVLKEALTSDGDPAFLDLALRADGELRKLHGINAPKKLDILDQRRPLQKLTDEELRRRAAENAAELGADA